MTLAGVHGRAPSMMSSGPLYAYLSQLEEYLKSSVAAILEAARPSRNFLGLELRWGLLFIESEQMVL